MGSAAPTPKEVAHSGGDPTPVAESLWENGWTCGQCLDAWPSLPFSRRGHTQAEALCPQGEPQQVLHLWPSPLGAQGFCLLTAVCC